MGDKVRLTGDQWDRDVHDYGVGDIVTVTRVDSVNPCEGNFTGGWFVWTADTPGNEGAYQEWGGDILSSEELKIQVGDTVRILPSYDVITDGEAEVGKEFEVTKVISGDFDASTFYVEGDPRGWGIWGQFVEKVFK